MGIINIETVGSFPYAKKSFGAMNHGHAQAVADAITWLSGEVLPLAIAQDHDLHTKGAMPAKGFAK